MQIHRLLTEPHAKSLLQGSFRFGRLRYYQMLENVFADESIGDAQEGAVTASLSVNITPENMNDPIRINLEKSGFIKVSGNSSVEIHNATLRNEIDCFVCCWSTSPTPNLSGTGSGYDTSVTATGAKSLAHYLNNLGVERESGSKIPDLFFPIVAGRVQYGNFDYDMTNGPLPSGNPFQKRTRYQYQSEYRLVLRPRKTIDSDFVTIECPQAAELLKSASIKSSQVAMTNTFQTTEYLEELEELLFSILAAWHELEFNKDLWLQPRIKANQKAFAAETWRADVEKSQAIRTEAMAKFDHMHLNDLQRCLFELRKPPFNDALDLALAHGASSDRLIHLYDRQKWSLPLQH